MIRLFTAIAIPDRHRQQLAVMSHGIEGARWVDEENLHVTLRFIGEVDEDVADDLAAALDTVTAAPFELAIKDLGTFGHPPHALWAGVEDAPKGGLTMLQAHVESALVRAGLPPEGRKFSPHITLARFKRVNEVHLARFMEGGGGLNLPPFCVTAFTLFRSFLGHEGVHYEALAQYDFT